MFQVVSTAQFFVRVGLTEIQTRMSNITGYRLKLFEVHFNIVKLFKFDDKVSSLQEMVYAALIVLSQGNMMKELTHIATMEPNSSKMH